MEKAFHPGSIESRWSTLWEERGFFQPPAQGPVYSMVIPPPNVTGTLHMGHGFQTTLMDVLIRAHRMRGYRTLWVPGTDHAGIATQMVVERRLAAEGLSKASLGRDAFVSRIWDWKKQSGGMITHQQRRMGASLDWSRECFTLDAARSRAVTHAFVTLYRDRLIYRGQRLVNWDPVLGTALSDLEVLASEEQGKIWTLHYPSISGEKGLHIATTRPETVFGDVAVAVHPEDARYQSWIGKYVHHPLAREPLPVIADARVLPEFGTGCVKITPAHDFNDYQIGEDHGLPMISVMGLDARMNDQVPEAFRGLSREEARGQVLRVFQEDGLLLEEKPHGLHVPRGDRSGAILEPLLTPQWFVRTPPLAEPAAQALRDGSLRLIPEHWGKTYLQWLENIEDWCISRQLWWGHRIPAWYDAAGACYVGVDEAEVRQHYDLKPDVQLRQDEDVLDTWFSSALWPFSTMGWPESTQDLQTFFPTRVLVTGFDIIFFWVARMVMMSLYFMKTLPFTEVYVTGLIRDAEGQKMSKSKGNVLDPIDLIDGIELSELLKKNTQGLMQPEKASEIEKKTKKHYPEGIPSFGVDALRFTFCALSNTGRDIRFDMGRVAGYRNFCNKLWNASRFVMMNTEEGIGMAFAHSSMHALDQWIVDRFMQLSEILEKSLQDYRFDQYAEALYEFTWNDYCDTYIEVCKMRLQNPLLQEEHANIQKNMLRILEGLLRFMHPVMPFITEEIWNHFRSRTQVSEESLSQTSVQDMFASCVKENFSSAAHEVERWRIWLGALRSLRSEMGLGPQTKVPLTLRAESEDALDLKPYEGLWQKLSGTSEVSWMDAEDQAPQGAFAHAEGISFWMAREHLGDPQVERARIEKELARCRSDIAALEARLAAPDFSKKAPASVVSEHRDRLMRLRESEQRLLKQQRLWD